MSKHHETTLKHLYLSRAMDSIKCVTRFCGLGNITVTNKMNKLLFLIDRLVWHVLLAQV